ncbi:hypothetical protein B0H11DRAFT_2205760 [Mycena galericulata]|nr:hypothetical protein B0H11DRAFT_2205760 [Mycena galericulata]
MFGQLCLYLFFLPPLICFPLLLPFKGIHNGGNKIRPPAAMDTSESMSQNSGKQLNNWPLLAGLGLGSCLSATWPSVQTSAWWCLPSDFRWICTSRSKTNCLGLRGRNSCKALGLMQKICLLVQDIIPATVSFCVSFGSVPESPIQAGPGFRESFACRNTWATNTECRSSRRGTSFLPAFIMSLSATFCSKQLSTSFDPFSEQSRVTLDWIIANGIPAPQSAASGILTVPSSGTVCSMPIKLSVCSGLPYDFVLGRDWSFFCCQTLPYASFNPSHLIDTSDSSATDITTQGCDKMRNPQTKFDVSLSPRPDRSACRAICQDFESAADMSKAVLNMFLDATDKQLSIESFSQIGAALNISVAGVHNVCFKLQAAIWKLTKTINEAGAEFCSSASMAEFFNSFESHKQFPAPVLTTQLFTPTIVMTIGQLRRRLKSHIKTRLRAVPLVGLTSFITYGSLFRIYSVHAADYTLAFCSLAILTLRVYALFNRKRVILWLLSLAGLGSLAAGVWLGSAADTAAPLPGSLCMLSHVSWCATALEVLLIAAVDVANILSTSSAIKPFLAGSLAWLASVLSAVLTARLILNMREVADTNSMAVGDVASVEVSTVEWNDIDLLEVMVVSVGTGNER